MANENIYPPFRYTLGRPLKYQPDELLEKFQEYVVWAKDNPISVGHTEKNTSKDGGTYSKEWVELKPRLVSISGFLVHLGIERSWWDNLGTGKRGQEFLRVKSFIRDYCETYQKEMATNDIFNANIISRLLGLADKKEVKADLTPVIVVKNQEEKKKIEGIGDIGV